MLRLAFDTAVDQLHPFRLTNFDEELETLIANAKKELVHKINTLSDGQSATWGFFPELKPDLADYPACVKLQDWFDDEFLTLPRLTPFQLQLAFIRLATAEPQSTFGGLHIDASAGIDHLPDKDRRASDNGILRVLINLYHEPRELEYSPTSIDSLRNSGVDIPDDHYQIIDLPKDMPLTSYFVKPREPDTIHGVMFESSSVLHAGRTNQKGHFLLSYGAYTPTNEITKLFA